MALGNLSVKVNADIGGFTTGMEQAAQAARQGMGASSSAVDAFRASLMQGSADMRAAAAQIGGGMEAANAAIMAASKSSEEALRKLKATAGDVDTTSMGEKIAYGIGAGVGAGIVAAQTAWEAFVQWTKAKAIITGVVIGTIFAAVGLGAIYTAYKVISGSIGFIAGLITGDSYKSASIDALIVANNQVKEIQNSLLLTAQQAAATNAAIAAIGANKTDYIAVFTGAATAVRANTEELDRLGIKYKDNAGKLLPLEQVVKNVNQALGKYTEGWDRNQAASAIGIGTAAQVAAAAAITGAAIAAAGARLDDYNLGIGEESQAAVKRYEDAMTAFNHETDLTAQGFKRAWADQIMPILTDFAIFFKDGFPYAVNAFRYSMATITSLFYGMKTVVYMVSESIVGSISAIGLALGGVAVAGMKVLSGDFSGAKDALVSGWADAKTRLGGIGENIVAQARNNANAMRQAWALDDRNAPGLAEAQKGKPWTPKPLEKKIAGGALDDPAKKLLEGQLKAQEAFIAAEQKQLATREGYLSYFYQLEYTNASQYYSTKQQLIQDALKAELQAYDAEAAAITIYIAQAAKLTDQIDGRNKLAEVAKKRQAAEVEASKKLTDAVLEQTRAYREFDLATTAIARQALLANAQAQFQIDLLGKSTLEVAKLSEEKRIQLALEDRLYQIRNKGLPESDAARAVAEAELQKVAAINLIQKSYTLQRDAIFGANEAVRKYSEDVSNNAAHIESALTNAFKGAEDALVAFVRTGKLDFKSLAASILDDIARIIIRQQISNALGVAGGAGGSGVLGLIGGLVGAVSGTGGVATVANALPGDSLSNFLSLSGNARAAGGPVSGGSAYLIGEKGPEIFKPGSGGTIIPNDQLGSSGAGGGTVINNYSFGAGVSRAEAYEGYRRAKAEAVGDVIDGQRRRRFA